MKKIISALILALAASTQALAATGDTSLEDQLKALDMPNNQAPAVVSKEKLYTVQTRYAPLKNKSEVSIGIAQNFTGNSYLTTQQFELGYRFHFSDRWAVGLSQAFVSNSFTAAAQSLILNEGIAPNLPYVRQRTDLTAEYNLFYGKFRVSSDQVFYFDQYIAVGPGLMTLNTGSEGAGVGDIGLAFWMGHWGAARVGLKDYVYIESDQSSTTPANNLHAHVDIAYLF